MRLFYSFVLLFALQTLSIDVPVVYGVLPTTGPTLHPTIIKAGETQAQPEGGLVPQPIIEPEEGVSYVPAPQAEPTTFDLSPAAPKTPDMHRTEYFLQKLMDATQQMESLTQKVELLEHEIHLLKTQKTELQQETQAPADMEPADGIETPTPLTAEQLYDKGRALITQKLYAEARDALLRLVHDNPDHSLISPAHYWIGETYFVEGNYEAASKTFADGYQKNAAHHKAPDHLLKLAMSFDHMGQKDKACITFKKLLSDFPKASETILSIATREMDKLQCSA